MKVLVIHGSKRRNGTTGTLAEAFIRGAETAGHEIERVELGSLSFGDCLGCNACMNNGGTCVQKDVMHDINTKIAVSDVIVLASPLYFYTWPSLMKKCLDRTYSQMLTLTGKSFILITAGEGDSEKYFANMLADFRDYVGCFKDCKVSGHILGIGLNGADSARNSPAFTEAYEMGKSL